MTVFVFYETACSTDGIVGSHGTCFSQPTEPIPVAGMLISDATGLAYYPGFGNANVSDPTFQFWTGGFTEPPVCFFFCGDPGGVLIRSPDFAVGSARGYNITWSATGAHLHDISAYASEFNTTVGLGLNSGVIGEDASIGTCQGGPCYVTGFWRADTPVPEPGTYLLLASLLGILVLGRNSWRGMRSVVSWRS